ncbi:MAG: hypothetical protein JW850_17530 [Thermoflexales bacterium]|nr:hypothetical protein [Thermoflexales bacterium]
MDELVKLVVKKTGLPEATAKQAVEVVIGFLKKKLPAPVGAQIDTLLASGQAAKGAASAAQALGGLLGKKK